MRIAQRFHSACALLTTLLATHGAHAWRLEDSLRGSTQGHPVGGAIQSDGWHVTARTDRLWYAIPRLERGSIEFTVTGLTNARLDPADDNELFAMYEAGYGISEPISYGDFRENHYKCMLRIYGAAEGARRGQQKLMWGMCPSGAPGYGRCGCASFFEEPFGGNGTWSGAPERLRIEWGEGRTSFLRNGTRVESIDWSRSGLRFGPQSLHFSLGTSRPSAVGGAALPVGIVFSDLVVDGTEGALAVCPGAPVTDAGSTTPTDTGVALPMNIVEIPVMEDVTVAQSLPDAVYPDVSDLSVGADDSEFYLKFQVGTLPGRVVGAQIVLRSSAYRSAVGDGASIFRARRSDWSELTLRWRDRPGGVGDRLARINGVAEDTRYAVDLPAGTIPGSGTYAFAVLADPRDANSAHFDARERGGGRGPILRLTLDPTMPPNDAGAPLDAAAPLDATTSFDLGTRVDTFTAAPDAPQVSDVIAPGGPDAPVRGDAGEVIDAPVVGGCGCRTAPSRAPGWAAALALLGLSVRRRRATKRA